MKLLEIHKKLDKRPIENSSHPVVTMYKVSFLAFIFAYHSVVGRRWALTCVCVCMCFFYAHACIACVCGLINIQGENHAYRTILVLCSC